MGICVKCIGVHVCPELRHGVGLDNVDYVQNQYVNHVGFLCSDRRYVEIVVYNHTNVVRKLN
jgi:hypothetical protein